MFEKKNVFAGLILSAILGIPTGYIIRDSLPKSSVLVQDDEVEAADGEQSNVKSVVVGELITLESDGDYTAWTIEPEVTDYVAYGSRNECCAVSFRAAGRYVVFASAAVGDKVVVTKYVIQVGGGAVPSGRNSWSSLFSLWNVPDKVTGRSLASSFRKVADQIEQQIQAGVLVDQARIMALTKAETQKALGDKVDQWRGFFEKLHAELGSRADAGTLDTMQDHVRTWREIASGFDSQ